MEKTIKSQETEQDVQQLWSEVIGKDLTPEQSREFEESGIKFISLLADWDKKTCQAITISKKNKVANEVMSATPEGQKGVAA